MWKMFFETLGAATIIFSAIVGFAIWVVEKKIEKREAKREEKEADHNKFLFVLLKSTSASITLSEATAKAVQRIPDARCNGDMHEALNYTQNVKHELKDFMYQKGIQNINE